MNRIVERAVIHGHSVLRYVGRYKHHPEGDVPAEVCHSGVLDLMARLAKYEDSGLEPVEIADCTPTAEVKPVRPELLKAVKLLGKNYERGLNSDYVRDPVAWAMHQTWKEMDGGADNG